MLRRDQWLFWPVTIRREGFLRGHKTKTKQKTNKNKQTVVKNLFPRKVLVNVSWIFHITVGWHISPQRLALKKQFSNRIPTRSLGELICGKSKNLNLQ